MTNLLMLFLTIGTSSPAILSVGPVDVLKVKERGFTEAVLFLEIDGLQVATTRSSAQREWVILTLLSPMNPPQSPCIKRVWHLTVLGRIVFIIKLDDEFLFAFGKKLEGKL